MSDKPIEYKPISGNIMPRYAGIATFMRLPHLSIAEADEVDIGLVGVPWDGGTTNRAGARHGPRQMRDLSTLTRNVHHALGIRPYELANCADLGDAPVNPIDLMDTMDRVQDFYDALCDKGIIPLTAGGDHLISLPILRALARVHGGPIGMVHFDAHTDTWDRYFGDYQYTHGTPFRRAIEEGALDPKRTIQIGIRGGLYTPEDKDWGIEQGIAEAANEVYRERGYETGYRTGRSIGMAYLESPELKKGDKTLLQAGMTFAVDGGISVDGELGGRIGDSIVVTETGSDYITRYPREILMVNR